MNFIYKFARLPKEPELLMNINSAANRLYEKLKGLDVTSLDISDYNRRYFGDYLKYVQNILQKYSYILAWSVASANCPLTEFVFLEYGGGSGVLSLLAKELKLGTVIYNDIYEVSCKDAKFIGESIGNQADYYVKGDIDDVICLLRKNSISCNAIASYDVIEHIYNIEDFLRKLHFISDKSMNVVMSSGANTFNPFIRRIEMKHQIECEYKDREKKWGHKERDCLTAYLKVREKLITKCAQNLTKEQVEKLARATRGMIESDIVKCTEEYIKTEQFPQEPNHPTNTCDPYTGNWAEHLMDIYHLRDILSKSGFHVEILSGYFGYNENSLKSRLYSDFLNLIIYNFKEQGIRCAPFFTIYGKMKPCTL